MPGTLSRRGLLSRSDDVEPRELREPALALGRGALRVRPHGVESIGEANPRQRGARVRPDPFADLERLLEPLDREDVLTGGAGEAAQEVRHRTEAVDPAPEHGRELG